MGIPVCFHFCVNGIVFGIVCVNMFWDIGNLYKHIISVLIKYRNCMKLLFETLIFKILFYVYFSELVNSLLVVFVFS